MNFISAHKRTLLLAAALLVLLGLYLIWVYPNYRKSANARAVAFALTDTASITRIVLTDQLRGETQRRVTLTRNAGGWDVNGQFQALEPRVRRLLQVMAQIHVKEALAERGLETGKQIVELRRIHVEVFAGNDRVKSYFLSTEAKDGRGSLMLMDGAKTPYIVALPGHQGFINGFFNPDTLLWRENLLFNLDPAGLSAFSVQFPDQPADNFTLLTPPGGALAIEGMKAQPPAEVLQAYAGEFKGKVYAESFLKNITKAQQDSIFSMPPAVILEALHTDGTRRKLVLVSRGDENPNSYFGWLEPQRELLTVQHYVIDRYIRRLRDFSAKKQPI